MSIIDSGTSGEDINTGGSGTVNLTDSGTGTESLSVIGFLSIGETGSGTETLTQAAFLALADALSSTEAISITANLSSLDTGAGIEGSPALFAILSINDTASGIETGNLNQLEITTSDTGTLTEALSILVLLSASDTITGLDVTLSISGGTGPNEDRVFTSIRSCYPYTATRPILQFTSQRVIPYFTGQRGMPIYIGNRPLMTV